MPVVSIDAPRHGQYAVLQTGARNLGVLLLNPANGRLWVRLRDHWYDDEDQEVFAALEDDLAAKAAEMGGGALLAGLEDSLSNALRITERQTVANVLSFRVTLAEIFEREVEPAPVSPYRTHLPLFSLRAAAGRFGDEETVEPEGWLPVSGRLSDGLFLARVAGRSMEPRIPDDSLNVFRWHQGGSRQGRIVLVELYNELPGEGRYVVKRYTSAKRSAAPDQWEHESIRLESINPEFPPIDVHPDQLKKVIAEWVETLE